ncbi:dTDP-4-dehydrorhamnose reductase [Klebsiella pneumoniae]|nr:dTDP-4-dehydrorhamnose reductase [Klebsiella pneumoniae]
MDNCPQPKTTAARRLSPFAVNRVAKNFYRTIFDNYPLKAARFLLLFAPPFSVGHRKSAAPALTRLDGIGV